MKIKANTTTKKTKSGNKFIAIEINEKTITKYLEALEDLVGGERFNELRHWKKSRDGEGFHITVINPREYRKNIPLEESTFEIALTGIGSVNESVYFIVAECPELDKFRERQNLSPWDYHITLGFIRQDIHGVPKDDSTLVRRLA